MGSRLRADVRTIFACLSRSRRRELGLLILLMPATAFAEALTVAAIVPFLALLSGQPVAGPMEAIPELLGAIGIGNPLWVAALLFALIVALTAALRLCLSWLGRHFAFALGHEVAVEIQRRLLSQPYAYHLRRHSSEHLAALDKVDLLVFDLVIQGVQAISALLIGAFILALLVAIDPLNSLLAFLFVGGFYALAMTATRKGLQHHGAIINSAYEHRTRFVQESVGGIRDLILDHSQEAALDRFREIDAEFAKARTRTAFLAAAPRFLIEAAGLVVIALLAIMIAGESGGVAAALPFLGALALGAMRLLPLIGQLYGAWANLAVAGPILTDVATILRLPLPEGATRPEPIMFNRSIELHGVSFSYADRVHRAVEDIRLTIAKGARVAITGKTGSGKSTLADLLMGLIEPDEGSVLIDGLALTPDRLRRWRRSIAHVPQQLFECTGVSRCGNYHRNGLGHCPARSSVMLGPVRKFTTAAVALALCAVPTGTIAARPAAPAAAPAATTPAPSAANPWLTLSAMTSSSASASTAAAAQGGYEGGPGFPPIPVLAVLLATIGLAVFIAVDDEEGDDGIGIPISP